MTHPEYAKLFTTYLELQRYQAIQEAMPGDLELTGSGEKQEDGASDKKDDWNGGRPWPLPDCTERQNTVSTALRRNMQKMSSALQWLSANPSHLPQQSHVIGYMLAFL